MSHTTHYACAEQIKKWGGAATCCACGGHDCKPRSEIVSYSSSDPKDSYDYKLGYNTALSDVVSMLPHDAPLRWRLRIEGLKIE